MCVDVCMDVWMDRPRCAGVPEGALGVEGGRCVRGCVDGVPVDVSCILEAALLECVCGSGGGRELHVCVDVRVWIGG